MNIKLETLEERFAYAEIDRGLYDKLSTKLKAEITSISTELGLEQIDLTKNS